MNELGSSLDKDDIDMYEMFSDEKDDEPPQALSEPFLSFNSTDEVYQELFVI